MKVIIVGGGFGGVRAALKLANKPGVEVKLISKQAYFEYHAALYRSATGRSPLEVVIPLRDLLSHAKNIEIVEDEIIALDKAARELHGLSGSRYSYEKLILAIGAVTDYYGIKGLEQYSFGVKTIHEALELKRRLHENLLTASKPERNYVVIGAGPTGVELAAELMPYLKRIRRKHRIKQVRFNIELIEAGKRILPTMPRHFSKKVQRRLRRLNVKLHTSTAVQAETAQNIQLPNGSIESKIVIWTAGTSINPFFTKMNRIFQLSERKRVVVNSYLEAAPDIYVIGDCAETPFSGMAQTALHNANFVVKDILRQNKNKLRPPYYPKIPVYAIPVGPHWSAVLWGKLILIGRPGWALRRLADLRLYLLLLPPGKALSAWRYGMTAHETCEICN